MTTLFVPFALLEACAHWYNGMWDPLYALHCRATCPPYQGIGELTYRDDEPGYPVDLDDEDIAALDRLCSDLRAHSETDDMEWSTEDACESTDDERALWAADVWIAVSNEHDVEQERRLFWENTKDMTRQELIEHRVY